MKKVFNNIRSQLILGISMIVLSSTVLIAIIFISQYKNLTLKQIEKEINAIATEFVEVGKLLVNPNQQRPRRVYIDAMRNLSNAEVWIIGLDGRIILDTTEKMNLSEIEEIISKNKNIDKNHITYDYTHYFNNKTMSITKPIIQNGNVGLVIVHKDVNNIYESYASFTLLVYFVLFLSVVISVILSVIFSNYFTRPLNKITETAKKIKAGDYTKKTEIKRNDQIGELAENIDLMSTEIDKKIKEVYDLERLAKDLVSNVSHEFKTPLTLIKGYTINMKDKITKPNKRMYDKIINNTEILENLVNSLLEINNYQRRGVKLKKEELNLKELIEEVISDMKIIAKNKKIEIRFFYKKAIKVQADRLKIKQLLIIFIDNAIKYSDTGKKIKISLKEDEIEIIDQGIGMGRSELEKIFNKYYKIDGVEKGYGLGLFIAKQIIDLHEYDLKIESKEKQGTIIKIILAT